MKKLLLLSILPLFFSFTLAHDCRDLPDLWRVIEKQKADFQVRSDTYELRATYYNGSSSERAWLLNEYYELEEQRANINTDINYYNNERRWCDRQEEKYWDYLREGGRALKEFQDALESDTYKPKLLERGISNYQEAYNLAIDAMLDVPNLDGLKDQIEDLKYAKKKADAMEAEAKAQIEKTNQEAEAKAKADQQKKTELENKKNVESEVKQNQTVNTSSSDGVEYRHKADELKEAIQWMYHNGLTKYDNLQEFLPYDEITREQASKFFVEFAVKVLGKDKGNIQNYKIFSDLNKADPTLKDYIIYANNMGLFQGSNGKFMPFNKLTKAQALAVAIRMVDGYLDESGASDGMWYSQYAKRAEMSYKLNRWGFYNNFDILDSEYITRGDMAIILYDMYLYRQSSCFVGELNRKGDAWYCDRLGLEI